MNKCEHLNLFISNIMKPDQPTDDSSPPGLHPPQPLLGPDRHHVSVDLPQYKLSRVSLHYIPSCHKFILFLTIQKFRFTLVVAGLIAGNFLYALDNTIVADIQPSIILSFNAINELSWIPNAYVLTGTAFVLLWSKAYALFNQKWLYVTVCDSDICFTLPSTFFGMRC